MYVTFSNPVYLWFLFLIPVLIFTHFFFLKKSRSKAIIFSNLKAIKRMAKGNILTANIAHLVVRCLVILALVIAASGATIWIMGERSDVNVIIAIDSSASMTTSDVGVSRFDTAKSIASTITNNVPGGASVALINFAGITKIQNSFTEEKVEILLSLEQLSISRIGGTDLSGAIITSTNLFELKPDEGKTLIILSDGLNNVGSFISGSPNEAISYAAQNQVVIHSVAIGTEEGGSLGFLPEYYDIRGMFDDELMTFISEETGGNHHRVESMDDVQGIINSLEFDSSRAYINYNIYYYAFILIFLLLVFEWVIANTVYRRVI